MIDEDFPSNRLFDALSCGTFVISDNIPSANSLFEGSIVTYNDENDLIYITSTDAVVKDSYDNITLNNVNVNSDFINGTSKTIIFNGDTDEILMKDRPELIFYNIIEDN